MSLPNDVELEQHLLGALIKRNEFINVAAAELEIAHLFDPLHGRIFETMLALSAEGSAVTPELIASIMKRDPGLIEVGTDYLRNLSIAASWDSPIKDYCTALKQFALRRELILIAEGIHNDATEENSPQPIADAATERLLLLGRAGAKPVVSAYDLATQTLREVEAMHAGASTPIVKTGLKLIDEEIGGFRGGELITIAGKSGMGKSALMGGIARNTSFAGVPTIVFSLEMTRRQWINRMVCDIDFDTKQGAMWYSRWRNGRVTDAQFDRYAEAAQRLHDIPFEIRDEDDVTIQQITAIARAFKAKHSKKTGIVFIDYLQIINPGETRERSREQVVNSFARGAKSLAKLLDWPVVAGSQMNEGAESRAKEERRPQASDVRESKGIMNESDMMLSPYREAFYVENRKPLGAVPGGLEWTTWSNEMNAVKNKIEVLALKSRDGHKFDVQLWCDMGASAIRDEEPGKIKSVSDEDVKGLLV